MTEKPTSALAPGHIVLHVKDTARSVAFYDRVGLPAFAVRDDFALIELRGGTHIIIMSKTSDLAGKSPASRYGQMGHREAIDMMIDSDAREELEAVRQGIIDNGIAATEISDQRFFGHYYFKVEDPDGHGITFYTSHEVRFRKNR